jgi:hypothetical protein
MLDGWRRERFIRKTLHRVSQQRVALVLQPGNVWVVEKAVSESEGEAVTAALRTCHLRGWVDVLERAIPQGSLTSEGNLPPQVTLMSEIAPVYRLTETGWNVLHRSHEWVVVTCFIAAATLIAAIIGIFITNALIG